MSLDRTRDFLAAARAAGAPQYPPLPAGPTHLTAAARSLASVARSTNSNNGGASAAATIPQTRSAFMRAVGEVSGELQAASKKLAALTVLVRRRGMLADPGHEIEALTGSVKGDIGSLTGKLDALSSYVDAKRAEALGAAAGAVSTASTGGGDAILASAQGISHSQTVLASLRARLLGFGKSLKGILVARTESLKSTASRRHALGASRALGLPPPASAAQPTAPTGLVAAASVSSAQQLFSKESPAEARARRLGLAAPIGSSAASGASAGSAAGASGASVVFNSASPPGADPFAQVQQSALLPASDLEAAYLDARAADVQALERHIGDLSGLFGRLAVVVHEQGALVERIEDNVADSVRHVGAAQTELQRAWERARSNGGLALRITAVLLLFIFLFVFFA